MKSEETILGCLSLLAFAPLAVIGNGVVLAKLWLWFLVPIGVQPIGVANAVGISIVASMFRNSENTEKNDDSATVKAIKAISGCALKLLIAYYFGMFVHCYM